MKKIILITTLTFSLSILLMPAFVFADFVNPTKVEVIKAGAYLSAGNLVTRDTNLPNLLGTIINSVMGLIGSVFLAFTITGGVLWIMAGGSEDKVTRAKKFITGGIMGLFIIFLAYTMVYFVVAALDFAAQGTT